MAKEDFTFFWSGPFSQWHPSPFEIDGTIYTCAEQYMMEQKALFFKDEESALKIMGTKNPKTQKSYGRKVKNFDADKWSEVAYNIVLVGNIAKFGQNENLYKFLVESEGTEIVEASPFDVIWGIGLGEYDELAFDKKTWKGKNLLGKVLDETREILKKR